MYISKFNRSRYDNFLDDPRNKLGRYISNSIFALLIIFILAFVFESMGENEKKYAYIFYILNFSISFVFLLEYIFRLVTTQNLKKFLSSPARLVDLLSFFPFFLGMAIGTIDFGKFLRLMRVLSILRVIKKIPLTGWFLKSLKQYKDEYYAIFLLFFVVCFIGSVLVYYFEKDVVWTTFSSVPMSLWWGLVTITTVWYWDMYPVTNIGRSIAAILVFVGPLLLALSSAVTFMVFTETSNNQKLHIKGRKKCHRCEEMNPRVANYCMKCWYNLSK